MSDQQFRDAIAHALMADGNVIGARHGADAVLAMPEMQAIFDFLAWFAHRHGGIEQFATALRHDARLPESVVRHVVRHAWSDGDA